MGDADASVSLVEKRPQDVPLAGGRRKQSVGRAAVAALMLYCIESGGWFPIESDFWAAGSGEQGALVAMHMGATAEEAVRYACLVDPGSGEPVHTLSFLDIQ